MALRNVHICRCPASVAFIAVNSFARSQPAESVLEKSLPSSQPLVTTKLGHGNKDSCFIRSTHSVVTLLLEALFALNTPSANVGWRSSHVILWVTSIVASSRTKIRESTSSPKFRCVHHALPCLYSINGVVSDCVEEVTALKTECLPRPRQRSCCLRILAHASVKNERRFSHTTNRSSSCGPLVETDLLMQGASSTRAFTSIAVGAFVVGAVSQYLIQHIIVTWKEQSRSEDAEGTEVNLTKDRVRHREGNRTHSSSFLGILVLGYI